MKELELNVNGMHCSGCENRIKNTVEKISGIKEVYANHETGKVKLVIKKDIDIGIVKEKIANLGFEVVE